MDRRVPRAAGPARLSVRLPRLLPALLLALLAAPVAGQSNDEIQTGAQFNFSTPGARSLALGGAFVGLADDATAAYSNPAGLVQLVRPEISVEARHWTYRSRFVERGHLPEAELTGLGIDTVFGLQDGHETTREEALAFLSYVWTKDRWAVAAYRHQLADFAASLTTQGPFVGPRESSFRTFPARSRLGLDIGNTGLSVGRRLGGGWSVGLGVSIYDFRLESRTRRYFRAPPTGALPDDTLTGGFYGPADFRDDNVFNEQIQTGDDTAFGWSLGWLWNGGRWSVGAVARPGPELDFRARLVGGPASATPGQEDTTVGGPGTFDVPDVYSVGLAFRPTEASVVTLDYARVTYSDLSDDIVNLLTAARGQERFFKVDDADEIRLGFEYQALALRYPVSFRVGFWHDPDHKIRYEGPETLLGARFRAGDDQLHTSLGLGLVVGTVQVDAAADLSDRLDTLALSTVVRF